MIGFARNLVETLVVEPQTLDTVDEERRIYLDPESRPIGSDPQEADVRALTSRPLSYEIGGGVEIRHTISVAVDVAHGDPVEALRRRDLIVLDLILRTVDQLEAIAAASDEETGQYVTRLTWEVDYRPLGSSDTNESAVITFDLDVELSR